MEITLKDLILEVLLCYEKNWLDDLELVGSNKMTPILSSIIKQNTIEPNIRISKKTLMNL